MIFPRKRAYTRGAFAVNTMVFIYLFIYIFIYLCIYLFVYLFIYLFIYQERETKFRTFEKVEHEYFCALTVYVG